MKELGIDADDLERKQKAVVDSDPRNKRVEEPRKRKSRTRTADTTATTVPTNVVVDTTNARSPVLMPDGTMPNGLPPNGEMPGGGPVRNLPPPLPLPSDSTKKEDVPR